MNDKQNRKNLKSEVASILNEGTRKRCRERLAAYPAKKIINPLFSFLYSTDEILKWRSISAMGMVTGDLFREKPESARVIMRRLIWNLNDESGGIGWGSPESMGEIMAGSKELAEEYNRILLSYVREDGNYLEYEMLQRGALWGIARLGGARPEYLQGLESLFLPYMKTSDPVLKLLAARCAVLAGVRDKNWFPESLKSETRELTIYTTWNFQKANAGAIISGDFLI